MARWVVEVSAIGATLLMQEQLKVTGFWSQLDTGDREDDNKEDDNVVDEDKDNDNDDNIMEEMPMDEQSRDSSRFPGWRHGCKHGNQSGLGGGGRTPPLISPLQVGGGAW